MRPNNDKLKGRERATLALSHNNYKKNKLMIHQLGFKLNESQQHRFAELKSEIAVDNFVRGLYESPPQQEKIVWCGGI